MGVGEVGAEEFAREMSGDVVEGFGQKTSGVEFVLGFEWVVDDEDVCGGFDGCGWDDVAEADWDWTFALAAYLAAPLLLFL